MQSQVNVVLPWPPTVNTYYACVDGRKVLSRKGREYKEAVKKVIDANSLRLYLTCDLNVSIDLYPPRDFKYDVDNYSKSIFDSLTAANFWTDDSIVRRCAAEKMDKVAGGRVVVRVSEYDG